MKTRRSTTAIMMTIIDVPQGVSCHSPMWPLDDSIAEHRWIEGESLF